MKKAPKKGLFIGNPHSKGGIPSEVKETGQQIEIEGDEYYICNEAYNSSKIYSFKGKTNKQILDVIYTENSCKLNQSIMSAGDFIVCKLVVKDSKTKDRSGTIKDIVNEMQGEKSCKVENKNSVFKVGGAIKTRTIKRRDGTEYEVKVYSEEELEARSNKKKESLKNISKNISKLRSVVNEDLKSKDEKDFLTALAVFIMLETSERVGNVSSADNGHYGVTGLKKSHIKITGNTVNFSYTGKSGVEHDKDVTNKRLVDYLKKAIKNSLTDEIFITSDGFKVRNDKVNRYLKNLNVSAKDIRGYSANNWIISKLKRLSPEDTDVKRKKQFNEVVKLVALKVGHGAATLKKHYLLPEIQINFIEKGKVIDLSKFKIEGMKFGGTVLTKNQKEKGGWSVSKDQRMSKGGEVVIDESISENPLSDPKVGMALITKVDENEPFPMVYYVLSIKKNDSGTIQSLRVGFKDASYTFGISLDDFMRTYIPATKKQVNFDNKSGATLVPDIFKKGGGVDTYKDKYNRKFGYKKGTSHNLEEISKDTGVSLKGLQQIYNKGIGAYKTNPQSVRPNVKSKEQWAMARVYSSVMGGNAAKVDSNELKMSKGGAMYEQGGDIGGWETNPNGTHYNLEKGGSIKSKWFSGELSFLNW